MISAILLAVCAAAAIFPNGVADSHGSSNVRLSDGNEGRPEFQINGVWYSLCDEGFMFFNMTGAEMLCGLALGGSTVVDRYGRYSMFSDGASTSDFTSISLFDAVSCSDFVNGSLESCDFNITQCSENDTIWLSCNCTFFQCENGQCTIDSDCNGISQCPNGEDEDDMECGRCNYMCADGMCVNGTRCDNITDCTDRSDEDVMVCENCNLLCDDGECVNGTLCDGMPDCMDGSDENSCDSCSSDDLILCDETCVEGGLCDGTEDCEDGSDEDNIVCDIATGLSNLVRALIGIFSAIGGIVIATPIAILTAVCICTGVCAGAAAKSSTKVTPMKKLPKPV